MTPVALDKPRSAAIRPGYRGLVAFCDLIGEPLEAYQRRIARAYFGPSREIAAILPRGNYKTSLAALIGLHHLLTIDGASVTIGAASVQQARICFERMRGFCSHPALEDELTVRHLELRRFEEEELRGLLRVIPSDGPRAHGLSSTLYIADEVWAWKVDGELLAAMQTGLVKRPDSKLLMISTAAAKLDSPLGRQRVRALGQSDVSKVGVVTEARGGLHWLEWSLPDDASLDDARAVKRVNPASYITVAALRRQREAVPEIVFAQFHACRWGVQEGAWLPAGAWQACAGDAAIDEGEEIWGGVDIGGSRAASAVVLVTEDLRVQARVWQGNDSVARVAEHVQEIAGRYAIRELAYDPWRFHSEALRLEERGVPVVEFPQSHSRMVPASERLHAAIVERRLTHGDDPDLNAHVAAAIAKQTSRGWRIDKATKEDQVDAVVALAMAVDRATQLERRARLIGWI